MSRQPMRLVYVAALTVATLAACHGAGAGGDVGTPVVYAPLPKLAADLHLMARGKFMDADDAKKAAARIGADGAGLAKYVDDLLSKDLDGKFAKNLLVSPGTGVKDRHPISSSQILKIDNVGGEKVYFLRKTCNENDVVKVKAWWDGMDARICAADYKPEVRGDDQGRSCGASVLDPKDSDVCGCGPMLVYCMPDKERYDRYKSLVTEELTDTVEYVVQHDMPLESALTMNESAGNEGSEYVYRRARVLAGEDPATLFPMETIATGKLRARKDQIPGQHAGVLTTPLMIFSSDALRGVMRNYFDFFWCSGVARSNVETDAVLALKKVDLRVGDGWKDLAALNICTDCHARMDYGMQFFWGYPSSTMGIDFRPQNARSGKGSLYNHNIKDIRGLEDLNPQGYAKLLTEQPEFGTCLTKKIADHVFHGTQTSEDLDAVLAAYKTTHRLQGMMRASMLAYGMREIARLTHPHPPAPTPAAVIESAPAVALADDVMLTVSPELHKLLKQNCAECHGTDDPYSLMGDTLKANDIALILDNVGFQSMPRDASELDTNDRLSIIAEASALLFADAPSREQAKHYYTEEMRASPVHQYGSAMRATASSVGENAKAPTAVEPVVAQSLVGFSPGVALSQSVVAMQACRKKLGTARANCLATATDVHVVAVGAP